MAADAASLRDVYDSFMDEWHYEKSPVIGASELDRYSLGDIAGASDALLLMYWDSLTYLPDDILTKVDRATMAVSLEGRVPYLDHRVAQLAARIPTSSNIRGKTGKLLLRKILYDLAPRQLFERPKAGFAVPVGQWIKGPLRPWAEELLDPKRLSAEGYFDAPLVRQRWDDHLSGRRDSTPALWSVLMFQSWLAHQT